MEVSVRALVDVLKGRRLNLVQIFVFSAPVLLGLILGLMTGRGDWTFAIVIAVLAPLVIIFSERPFIGVILWLLLMPLSSALPNNELMYWALHRILVPFTLIMTFLPYLIHPSKFQHIKFGLPELSIALLAVFVPLSILIRSSDTRQALINFADRMFIPFCMYLIVRLTILRSGELRVLQWAAFSIAASQCAIGFLSFFAPQFLPYAWRPLFRGYAAGSLLNPNVFASVLCFCVALLFNAAMHVKSRFVNFIFVMMSGVSLLFIALSMERAAWVAGGLVLFGLFVLYPGTVIRLSLAMGVFLAFLGGIIFSAQLSMLENRISNQGTIDARIVVTDAMIQMIQEKPIFGWGYGTLNLRIKDYYRSVGGASVIFGLTTSHNTFLTIFVELGLLGFMFYLLPVGWLLNGSYHHLRYHLKRNNVLAVVWLGVLGSFAISNFMDMRFFPIGLTFWWMELGLIANLIQQHSETHGVGSSYQSLHKRQVPPSNYELFE